MGFVRAEAATGWRKNARLYPRRPVAPESLWHTVVMLETAALPPRIHPWDQPPDPGVVDTAPLRLMALHAHPDDEASKGAGTVAMYASRGVRCTLVTATGGEEGEILNSEMDRPEVAERLHQIRLAELEDSVEICGYAAAYMLGYRDSGMPESEANARPEAFANAGTREALARLVRLVRAERPQVVLGYDDHHFYPHPDHVMVYKLGLELWDAAGDPDFAFDGFDLGEPWAPQKLYWFHWSMKRMAMIHAEFERRGWESPFGEWVKNRPVEGDEAITTQIDVGDYMDVRRAALVAHRTQVDPQSLWLRLPDDVLRDLHPFDDFVLARDRTGLPPWEGGVVESDLFAGIATDP